MTSFDHLRCPICGSPCAPLGTVDFAQAGEDERGNVRPEAGMPVQYVLGARYGWNFASFSQLLHVFYTSPPPWASQMMRGPQA